MSRDRTVRRKQVSLDVTRPVKIAASDVLWWAKRTEREPFVTAARRINRSQTEVDHVLWPLEGELVIVYKGAQKQRRREK